MIEIKISKVPKFQKLYFNFSYFFSNAKKLVTSSFINRNILDSGLECVITERFQIDPIERRYCQYQQKNGNRFSVSLKYVICCERIVKLKILIKEGINLFDKLQILLRKMRVP